MSPTLLILTPLLVLGVVLLLGFAGCVFDPAARPASWSSGNGAHRVRRARRRPR